MLFDYTHPGQTAHSLFQMFRYWFQMNIPHFIISKMFSMVLYWPATIDIYTPTFQEVLDVWEWLPNLSKPRGQLGIYWLMVLDCRPQSLLFSSSSITLPCDWILNLLKLLYTKLLKIKLLNIKLLFITFYKQITLTANPLGKKTAILSKELSCKIFLHIPTPMSSFPKFL